MTEPLLQDVEITNFRSIKGSVLAPLDAKVVLIHGENGAGKTSLLSAIEMALTGRVLSLDRADPNYTSQLLYRSADRGQIKLRTVGLEGNNHFQTILTKTGIEPRKTSRCIRIFFQREMLSAPVAAWTIAANLPRVGRCPELATVALRGRTARPQSP